MCAPALSAPLEGALSAQPTEGLYQAGIGRHAW